MEQDGGRNNIELLVVVVTLAVCGGLLVAVVMAMGYLEPQSSARIARAFDEMPSEQSGEAAGRSARVAQETTVTSEVIEESPSSAELRGGSRRRFRR